MPFDPPRAQSEPPANAPVSTRAASHSVLLNVVFGVVGLGLLAGAGAAYYFLIQRPLTWPRADAVVVSSRVVNPKRPSQYQPELVFRIESETSREVTVVPNWSSGSYDMVRSYVDGYPAGRTVSVAINPADASDVRHELGVTLLNAIVPAVLGLMGLFFLGIAWAARPRRPSVIAEPMRAQSVGWIGTLFVAIGVILGAIGGWLLMQDTPLDWPTTEAQALDGAILPVRSSSTQSSSRTSYDIQVTFSYDVDGRSYQSETASGSASGTRNAAEERLSAYAAGTKHAIHYRPDDPNVIRFELSAFNVYVMPVALLAMGAVFLFVGALVSHKLAPGPSSQPH